jgi:hypothetical protein
MSTDQQLVYITCVLFSAWILYGIVVMVRRRVRTKRRTYEGPTAVWIGLLYVVIGAIFWWRVLDMLQHPTISPR